MKKILMAAVALTALTATPAMATVPTGGDQATYEVNGSVANKCTGLTPTGTIAFGAIATDSNGKVTGGAAGNTLTMTVYCNSAGSKVTFSSTGNLTTSGTADSSQTNVLTYTPVVTYAGSAVPAGSTGLPVGSGTLTVTANALSSNDKIAVAGDYAGSITVTLTPAS